MKRKGFTLIELLAVIVILSVIALITTTVIIKVLENSRKNAAKNSALNYLDMVEKYIMYHDVDSGKYPYDLKGNTWNITESSIKEISLLNLIPSVKAEEVEVPPLNDFIKVKGSKPTSGTITIDSKGKIESAIFVINGYNVSCVENSCTVGNKTTTKKVTEVTITDKSVTSLYVGDTLTLLATTDLEGTDIEWISSDESIATVSDGVVTGISEGNVIITAKSGNINDTVELTINNVPNFTTDSWTTIISNIKSGNTSFYEVGDTKEVDMGDFGTHILRIANKSAPIECSTNGFSQTACGFVIEFADVVTRMNSECWKTTGGNGWPNIEWRTLVNNDIYNSLPNDLKSGIINTYVVSGHGNETTTNYTSTDKLYLLSWKEVYNATSLDGTVVDTAASLSRQLDYYKKNNVSLTNYSGASKNDESMCWRLRSANSANNYQHALVCSGGQPSAGHCWNDRWLSPAFRIG